MTETGTDGEQEPLVSALPDLHGVPLERASEEGGAVLAAAEELYRQRLKQVGEPISSFNSSI